MISQRLQRLANIFRYSVAASKFKYTFDYASSMIPHPAKAYKGGQDAIYASKNLLVVADGVGGWADSGVDPGLYSKKLCELIGKKFQKSPDDYINSPKKLLIQATKQNKQIGSTTVCMLMLHPQTGKIINYYLGDSVFGIFQDKKHFLAPEQQKSFNFPYQVGSVGDDPSQGIQYQLTADQNLQAYFVVGSDGVWDNYEANQIRDDIYLNMKDKSLKQMAEGIAKKTYKYSLNQNYQSPFYKKALSSGFRYYKSGKSDDISIIIAKIVKQQI